MEWFRCGEGVIEWYIEEAIELSREESVMEWIHETHGNTPVCWDLGYCSVILGLSHTIDHTIDACLDYRPALVVCCTVLAVHDCGLVGCQTVFD